MLITKAARRYATALLEISKERDEVEKVLEDIRFIGNTIEDSDDLILFLRSPIIKFDDKRDVLVKLFEDHVMEITIEFLKLLSRKNRVNLLNQICMAFIKKYNEYAGIVEIDVFVADDLPEDQKDELHRILENKTGKKVDLKLNRDTSLKGGMAVRIDDTVIDGTIRHKLQELENQLMAASVE